MLAVARGEGLVPVGDGRERRGVGERGREREGLTRSATLA